MDNLTNHAHSSAATSINLQRALSLNTHISCGVNSDFSSAWFHILRLFVLLSFFVYILAYGCAIKARISNAPRPLLALLVPLAAVTVPIAGGGNDIDHDDIERIPFCTHDSPRPASPDVAEVVEDDDRVRARTGPTTRPPLCP